MKKILIIDDDMGVRGILSKLLSRFGYFVREASDGEEGIELLKGDGQYKVVITDIRMPRKDGNDVARHVRNNTRAKDIMLIGVTGFMEDAEHELFDFLMPKPYKMTEIVKIINAS